MINKTFITSNYNAWIAYSLLCSPFIIAICCAVKNIWWPFVLAPLASLLLYSTVCIRFIGVLSFKNGEIHVASRLSVFESIQHKIKIELEEIEFADFCFTQRGSKGEHVARFADVPCLTLIKKDGNKESIILIGFSRKQILEIENLLLLSNKDLMFLHTTDRFEGLIWRKKKNKVAKK